MNKTHINDLTVAELEHEVGITARELDILNALGTPQQLRTHQRYHKALMKRLEELSPMGAMTDDELLDLLEQLKD